MAATWRLVSYLLPVTAKIDQKGYERMLGAVINARNEVVKGLRGARTGRRYKVPNTNTYYTASRPGERPAIQLGDLFRNVLYRVGAEGSKIRGIVGTNLKHGAILEFKSVREGGRPWLEPGLKDAKAESKRRLGKKWF